MKENSEAQTRPYVQVSLVPGVQLNGSIDLIIENRGTSAATNVRFNIAGVKDSTRTDDYIRQGWEKALKNTYSLAPNMRYRWMWASIQTNTDDKPKYVQDAQQNILKVVKPGETDKIGFNEEVQLRVDYQSTNGVFNKIRNYSDVYPLDAEAFVALAPQPFEGRVKSNRPDNSTNSLYEMKEALRTHNIHVGMKNF